MAHVKEKSRSRCICRAFQRQPCMHEQASLCIHPHGWTCQYVTTSALITLASQQRLSEPLSTVDSMSPASCQNVGFMSHDRQHGAMRLTLQPQGLRPSVCWLQTGAALMKYSSPARPPCQLERGRAPPAPAHLTLNHQMHVSLISSVLR